MVRNTRLLEHTYAYPGEFESTSNVFEAKPNADKLAALRAAVAADREGAKLDSFMAELTQGTQTQAEEQQQAAADALMDKDPSASAYVTQGNDAAAKLVGRQLELEAGAKSVSSTKQASRPRGFSALEPYLNSGLYAAEKTENAPSHQKIKPSGSSSSSSSSSSSATRVTHLKDLSGDLSQNQDQKHGLVALLAQKFEAVGKEQLVAAGDGHAASLASGADNSNSFSSLRQKVADRSRESLHWFWRVSPTWVWVALNMAGRFTTPNEVVSWCRRGVLPYHGVRELLEKL